MNWKIIWKSFADRDMQKRIFAVLGIIVVYRVMAHIPIPIGDSATVRQVIDSIFASTNSSQFLNFVNVLTGGALANFSIMLVGLGPYINASIIMQLLTKALPKLEELNKEGEFGRKKINQYTRMLTLPLAVVQSIGMIYIVKQQAASVAGLGDITANSSLLQWILMVCALTGGAMIMMWLGEMITEQNIGNGISLLITVSIVSSLPRSIASLVSSVFGQSSSWQVFGVNLPISKESAITATIISASIVILLVCVVKLNEARRNLTVSYAKRVKGSREYGGVTTVLPVKMITAGVVPIIFAVAFLSLPTFVGQILSSNSSQDLQQTGATLTKIFQTPTAQSFQAGEITAYIYPVAYFLLVFFFTFFYTSIAFNAKEIAENMQKQGGFISGVRSGPRTEKYLSSVVMRLTLFGAVSIGLLAVMPIIGEIYLGNNIAVSGTSILILVAVSLETLRHIESRALMITYDQYDGSDYFQQVEAKKSKFARVKSLLTKAKKTNK
ncbi:preprotein translocase subunit SecY [Candidatus Saccharibacteria bacterium RIFCSPHIGHO2_12_FULL_41_12]|nr:MAG: preprotein translocase subunit SecY [Candidatus Saccharibacteria bacterium RIFCSPHIGHO2_12_FULL_41_12]